MGKSKTIVPAVGKDGYTRNADGECQPFDVLGSYQRLKTSEQDQTEKQLRAAFQAGVSGKGWVSFTGLVSRMRKRAQADSRTRAEDFEKYLAKLIGAGGYGVRVR